MEEENERKVHERRDADDKESRTTINHPFPNTIVRTSKGTGQVCRPCRAQVSRHRTESVMCVWAEGKERKRRTHVPTVHTVA